MKDKKDISSVTYKGIGFSGLLAIVFIALKLLGVLSWSWMWVLAPLWMPLALAVIGGVLLLIVAKVIDK